MTPDLIAQLGACKTLPTPSSVATRIVSLSNDPDVDIRDVVQVLATDPAITAKIMRVVNSSMYGQQGKTENLDHAVIVLGLHATISLALSFSLISSFQDSNADGGLDYTLYWRRALLSATASRALAETVGITDAAGLFLASLVQDIGMSALQQSVPGVYENLPDQTRQAAIIKHERDQIGVDHACVGGWLLQRWNFPDRIQQAVAASHDPGSISETDDNALFARCVALTALIAEVFLNQTGDPGFQTLAEAAETQLSLDKDKLGELLEQISIQIPEGEAIFETQLLAKSSVDRIMDEAREALMLRSLHALQEVESLQDRATSLQDRTKELEETNRRDALTGLYNRRFLDVYLQDAITTASQQREPLSIAFADLDKFKNINDTYGHQVGDQILATTADILVDSVRSSDFVARFGGEEFIIVFPNTDSKVVKIICERIVKTFQETRHNVGTSEELAVTISMGTATHDEQRNFESVDVLVSAADKALYSAKMQGRNRSVPFDRIENLEVAEM